MSLAQFEMRGFREALPIDAELLGHTPTWHIIVTAPNSERIAVQHLAYRRFAVYLPEFDKRLPRSRRLAPRLVRRPLFPGYCFVLIWDISQHVTRLRACPGVVDLLRDGEGMPVTISDSAIRDIERVEFEQLGIGHKRRRRRWRRGPDLEPDDEIVAIRCYSALQGIERLDDSARNSVLHRALGLAAS